MRGVRCAELFLADLVVDAFEKQLGFLFGDTYTFYFNSKPIV